MSFCPRCGSEEHERCERGGPLDPPRFCARCGRRLEVQVLPDGSRTLRRTVEVGDDLDGQVAPTQLSAPAPPPREEAFRDLAVGDDGTIYWMQRTPGGVVLEAYRF